MKAIISSTYDDKYFYFLPICVWAWNKLGVDVICFLPKGELDDKQKLVYDTIIDNGISTENQIVYFDAPEHKKATYAQLSRLFVSGIDWIDYEEVFFCSDVDMINFVVPPHNPEYDFTVFGSDLTPKTQYPVCYVSATGNNWEKYLNPSSLTYQAALDYHLGHIECEGFRGNYWTYEQELLFKNLQKAKCFLIPRSNGENQFATKRYDRDDMFILDRLSPDTIDYHANRPAYEEKNYNIVRTILQYHYPNEDFTWLDTYRNEFLKLL